MSDFDRNTMIERYVAGRMGISEKKEFLDLLERDDELRRALYAETLINRAIRNDRSAVPSQPAASRARFLTMLATVAPEPAVTAPQPGNAPGAGKIAQLGRYLGGSGAAKTIIVTVAGISATVGSMVMIPKLTHSSDPPAPAVTGAAPRKPALPPVVEPAPESAPAEAPSPAAVPAEVSRPGSATGKVAAREASTSAGERKSPSLRERPSAADTRRLQPQEKPADVAVASKREEPVRITNDSVRVRLNVHAPKIKSE